MKLSTVLKRIIREEVRKLKEDDDEYLPGAPRRMWTPWGYADYVEDVGMGIKWVNTPSHGGYYVPSKLLSRIDPAGRRYAKQWSRSENWYEEDVGWAWVWVAFPELFKDKPYFADHMKAAKELVVQYGKKYATSESKMVFEDHDPQEVARQGKQLLNRFGDDKEKALEYAKRQANLAVRQGSDNDIWDDIVQWLQGNYK
jgi:hypothetical protein